MKVLISVKISVKFNTVITELFKIMSAMKNNYTTGVTVHHIYHYFVLAFLPNMIARLFKVKCS